jgi:hypothetical protein
MAPILSIDLDRSPPARSARRCAFRPIEADYQCDFEAQRIFRLFIVGDTSRRFAQHITDEEINNSARASVSARERICAIGGPIVLIRETFSLPLAGSSRLEVDSLSCRGQIARIGSRADPGPIVIYLSLPGLPALTLSTWARIYDCGGCTRQLGARPDDINIDNRASVHLPGAPAHAHAHVNYTSAREVVLFAREKPRGWSSLCKSIDRSFTIPRILPAFIRTRVAGVRDARNSDSARNIIRRAIRRAAGRS